MQGVCVHVCINVLEIGVKKGAFFIIITEFGIYSMMHMMTTTKRRKRNRHKSCPTLCVCCLNWQYYIRGNLKFPSFFPISFLILIIYTAVLIA